MIFDGNVNCSTKTVILGCEIKVQKVCWCETANGDGDPGRSVGQRKLGEVCQNFGNEIGPDHCAGTAGREDSNRLQSDDIRKRLGE